MIVFYAEIYYEICYAVYGAANEFANEKKKNRNCFFPKKMTQFDRDQFIIKHLSIHQTEKYNALVSYAPN